jgi:hypothetical protein
MPDATEDYVPQNLPPDQLTSDYDNSKVSEATPQAAE